MNIRFSLLCIATCLLSSIAFAQTIVEVHIKQAEPLSINPQSELYRETNQSIIFGENIDVSGGLTPYQYSWYIEDRWLGATETLEILTLLPEDRYSLVIKDANQCTAKLVLTSIQQAHEENTGSKVYPNPCSQFVVIDPSYSNISNVSADFYTTNGLKLFSVKLSGKTYIPLQLTQGIYIIWIHNSDLGYIERIKLFVI